MDFEQENETDNNLVQVTSKSDIASLINDGASSGHSDHFEPPPTQHRVPAPPTHRRRQHRNRKRSDSTEPTELDLLLLTDQIEALRRDLEAEQRHRQEEMKLAHRAIQRVYNDCIAVNSRESSRLATVEQKVDTVTGRYRGCHEEIRSLKKQIDSIINTASTLRQRIEDVERQQSSTHRRSQQDTAHKANAKTKTDQAQVEQPVTTTAQPTAGKSRKDFWSAQIIFVLNALRPNIFEVDGVAYLKLQSRSSRQRVLFSSGSALSFVLGIEGSFASVLRNRAWMPLASHRLSDVDGHARITLDRLPARHRESDAWDHDFLEKNCVTYDASGKAHIYIALQRGELTLRELSGAPPEPPPKNDEPLLASTAKPNRTGGPMPLPTPGVSAQTSSRVSARNSHDIGGEAHTRQQQSQVQIQPSTQSQLQPTLQALPATTTTATNTTHAHYDPNILGSGAATPTPATALLSPQLHPQHNTLPTSTATTPGPSMPFRNWTLHASQRTSYDKPSTAVSTPGIGPTLSRTISGMGRISLSSPLTPALDITSGGAGRGRSWSKGSAGGRGFFGFSLRKRDGSKGPDGVKG